jgi:two-component system sensor histidine kinase TctE
MKRSPVTLRRNLLNWLLALLVGLWFASAVAIYFISVHFVNLAYDRALADSLLSLAAQVHLKDGAVRVELPEPALRILEFDKYDRVYYKITGPDGRLISGRADLPSPPPVADDPGEPVLSDARLGHRAIRMASMRLDHDDSYVVVQIAETLTKRTIASREILWTIAIPQLIVIGLAVVAVWFGVSRGLAPLARLEAQVASRSPRDLRPVVEQGAPEEVHSLVSSINTLMGRLSKALETQRRFIADAAHQLRTPLAGLKTQLELAARQDDPRHTRELLDRLAVGIDQSSRLVGQLLALARAEHYTERTLMLEPVDLNAVARDVTSHWVPTALAKRIDLGFEGPEAAAKVLGDEPVTRELIGNLLDNAVRYTPPGGSITVELQPDRHHVHLVVRDTGPGIPEQERQRVFEPFYRGAATDTEGCGLGLTIVRELALAQQAECWLEAGDGGKGLAAHLLFTRIEGNGVE